MDKVREVFDLVYKGISPLVFWATERNPELAHSLFVHFCRGLYKTGLDSFVFDHHTNQEKPVFKISNAAGWNKNGELPPSTLQKMGFDRVVVGTVTNDPWAGNPSPRLWRYVPTKSIVNFLGLPGIGAKRVKENLLSYDSHNVPLTINLMSTPQKQEGEDLNDVAETILELRGLKNIDRFELNISCPNTHSQDGVADARSQYQERLNDLLRVMDDLVNEPQEIYVKVSPDLADADISDIYDVLMNHRIKGIVGTNTTVKHNPNYVPHSPGKGGASGDAVYDLSLRVQQKFYELMQGTNHDGNIIACGGISSIERAQERVDNGATEIQIYTPFIFEGPGLLRQLRMNGQFPAINRIMHGINKRKE